jgi:hypothetical protein
VRAVGFLEVIRRIGEGGPSANNDYLIADMNNLISSYPEDFRDVIEHDLAIRKKCFHESEEQERREEEEAVDKLMGDVELHEARCSELAPANPTKATTDPPNSTEDPARPDEPTKVPRALEPRIGGEPRITDQEMEGTSVSEELSPGLGHAGQPPTPTPMSRPKHVVDPTLGAAVEPQSRGDRCVACEPRDCPEQPAGPPLWLVIHAPSPAPLFEMSIELLDVEIFDLQLLDAYFFWPSDIHAVTMLLERAIAVGATPAAEAYQFWLAGSGRDTEDSGV